MLRLATELGINSAVIDSSAWQFKRLDSMEIYVKNNEEKMP